MKTNTSGYFMGDVSPLTKQKIENAYLRTKVRVEELCPKVFNGSKMEDGGACLLWAIIGAQELEEIGFDVQIQAGTMMWEIADVDKVPKTDMLAFGFTFGYDNPISVIAAISGRLPEMHIWLGIEGTTMIDFSTKYLKNACNGHDARCQWRKPDPPDYMVVRAGEYDREKHKLEHAAHYAIDEMATMIAIHAAQKLVRLHNLTMPFAADPESSPSRGNMSEEDAKQFQQIVKNAVNIYVARCHREQMNHHYPAGKSCQHHE